MKENYENRVVLFLDILGFAKIIENTVKNEQDDTVQIKKLYNVLEIIRTTLGVNISDTGESSRRITQFSDSIVISFLAEEKGQIFTLLTEIHFLVKVLVTNNILCRGGISYGKLIHDEKFVFGPALVDAYLTESKAAMYPRIILSGTIIELASKYHSNEFESPLFEIMSVFIVINKDSDEMYYIDFIEKSESSNDVLEFSNTDYADKVKEIALNGLKSTKPDIIVKYGWIQNKYNNLVDSWKKKCSNTEMDWDPKMVSYVSGMEKIDLTNFKQ